MIQAKHKFWTDKEVAILKYEYKKGTKYKDIGEILGRTKSTTQKKAKTLCLEPRQSRWTKQEKEKLKELYEKGLIAKEIATILGRSIHSIRMRTSLLGMSNRLNSWTNEEIEVLKEEYKKRTTAENISKILNRDIPSIRTKACSLGITMPRLYDVNHDYFSEVNTQKCSYWLGWLMSDGCVRRDQNRISLKLATKDKCIIEDFKADLEAENPIIYEEPRDTYYNGIKLNGTGSYILSVSSKKMKKDLAKYGVVPNKTYICEFPKKLNKEFYPGFIAGLISGDGSISIYKRQNALTGNFVGTKEIVESVKNILVKEIGYNPKKKIIKAKNSKSLYALYLSTSQVLDLYYWLKENGIPLMPRKNKIIEDYINKYPKKCNYSEVRWSKSDTDSLIKMYEKGIPVKEISKSIDRTRDAVIGKIKELEIGNRFIQWTNKDIEKLKLLRTQGNTFGQIAKILGKTERAAQGKHVRLFQPVKEIRRTA